jgi:hypothetical protein
VVGEAAAPLARADDERLHHRALGLNGVRQVVGGLFVEHLAESDLAQLRVAGSSCQVGLGHCGETRQTARTSLAEPPGNRGGIGSQLGLRSVGMGAESRKVPTLEESLKPDREGADSVSRRCWRHSTADHSPGAGRMARSSSSTDAVSVRHRSGVVDRTSRTLVISSSIGHLLPR